LVHDAFIEFGLKATARGVWVGRYVIMPDHIRLFAGFPGGTLSLSGWMKALRNSMSKALRDVECAGRHWQKGFFDHVIRSQESYDQKWLYVRENPVRAGLVLNAEDWPYAGDISLLDPSPKNCARS
jgi:putative transposase